MTHKESASSQQELRPDESEKLIVTSFTPGRRLSEEARRRLQKLADLPEDKINTEDIPELPPGSWDTAVRNPYTRLLYAEPRKAS